MLRRSMSQPCLNPSPFLSARELIVVVCADTYQRQPEGRTTEQ